MTEPPVVGSLKSVELAPVVRDERGEQGGVTEVSIPVAAISGVCGGLEDEGAEEVRYQQPDDASVVLDDDLLGSSESLGAALHRHDGMTAQPGLSVLREVIGDQDVDDVVIAPETVDR